MGMMKDPEGAQAAQMAVDGWLRYVQLATRDLAADHPVDERMAHALAGEELPPWLEDGIRVRLVAARGQALVEKALARTSG